MAAGHNWNQRQFYHITSITKWIVRMVRGMETRVLSPPLILYLLTFASTSYLLVFITCSHSYLLYHTAFVTSNDIGSQYSTSISPFIFLHLFLSLSFPSQNLFREVLHCICWYQIPPPLLSLYCTSSYSFFLRLLY